MPLIRKTILLLLLSVTLQRSLAQDTLTSFTVKNRFGKVILGWVNPFDSMVQMNIQRSPDSLKGFKTILTVADPDAITNGYLDNKAPDTRQFYRIFVMRTSGRYFFTPSARPVVDSSREVKQVKPKPEVVVPPAPITSTAPTAKPESLPELKVDSVVVDPVSGVKRSYKIARNANGTGKMAPTVTLGDSLTIRAPENRPVFTPSVFVFSNPQGDVEIALPASREHVFTLKFYSEDGKPLFQMSKIRDSHLTLDKSNFIRSGWFPFELYEDGKMKEKRKVYVPKDR
jgi:hypothetical protein